MNRDVPVGVFPPTAPLGSSFTVVAATHDGQAGAPTGAAAHRGADERLRDAALAAVADVGRPLRILLVAALLVFIAGEALFGDPGRRIVSILCLGVVGVAGWAWPTAGSVRSGRAGRSSRSASGRWRLFLAAGAIGLAIVALPATLSVSVSGWVPGSVPVGAPVGRAEGSLVAGLLAVFALMGASSLAPLRPLAFGAAALPLAAGLFAAEMSSIGTASTAALVAFPAGPGPDAFGGWPAALLETAAAAALAQFQHRRWRLATRLAIEQAERLRTLEAARDAAVRADQEKSRFLAIASHDLRQPVHAIGLFAATLEKRLADTPEEPLVRNLTRAIDGLDRSFNVMLDISRLDAGAIEPRVQQFPLRDLFRRLHMHFAGQAEQKGLGLRFSPGGKSVASDPQLLERVLGNLVQNAIKYTERGGIVVVARSTPTHTHVEVWDTGIGIRAPDLRRVFDEFYQVGRGERVRAQGLGMGLAIVKRLVRLLGHELTIASRPGRGTMFRLAIALGGLPDIQDATAAADTLPMPLLQPRSVLVLDDEEPIREGLRLLLQEWGYDAFVAGTLDEALAAVDRLEAPPDLILSDLHLGDGVPDGIVAIDSIRRRCGGDVAAMLITGDTSHAEIRRATDSGHPVLFKPVQPRKLYDALRGLGS